MHKTLAIAALAAGLMFPTLGATARTATVQQWPPQCQNAGMGDLCDMEYDFDISMCELAPQGQQQGCRNEAVGRWAMCRVNSC